MTITITMQWVSTILDNTTNMMRSTTARTFPLMFNIHPRVQSRHTTIARRSIKGDGRSSNLFKPSINHEAEFLSRLCKILDKIDEDEGNNITLKNFTPLSREEIQNLLCESMLIASEGDPVRTRNLCMKLQEINRQNGVNKLNRLMKLAVLYKREAAQGST